MNKHLLVVVIAIVIIGMFLIKRPVPVAPVQTSTRVAPDQNLGELIAHSEKPVVIDFNASWCGPCKMMKPIFKEIEEELGDSYMFVDADVDQYQELAAHYQVTAMPTFVFVKDGVEVHRVIGGQSKEELKAVIEQTF